MRGLVSNETQPRYPAYRMGRKVYSACLFSVHHGAPRGAPHGTSEPATLVIDIVSTVKASHKKERRQHHHPHRTSAQRAEQTARIRARDVGGARYQSKAALPYRAVVPRIGAYNVTYGPTIVSYGAYPSLEAQGEHGAHASRCTMCRCLIWTSRWTLNMLT